MIINGRKLPMCVNTANFDNLGDDAVGYVYKWTYNGPVEKVKGKYYIGRRKIRGMCWCGPINLEFTQTIYYY